MPRALLILAFLLAPVVARADVMSFYLKNMSDRPVAVELFSHQRHKVWPGDGKVYYLAPHEKKSAPVDCAAGERICFGAWVYQDDRTRWGVGPDDDRNCDDCCRLCAAHSIETIVIGK